MTATDHTDNKETVVLSGATLSTFIRIRGAQGVADAAALGLDHVRCNVLMGKGLIRYLAPGKWEATELGRRVTPKLKA